MVECGDPDGVKTSKVSPGIDQILHFSSLPTDPTGYFDPETNTLYSGTTKVPSIPSIININQSDSSTENNDTSKSEKFKLYTDTTMLIFDSEGTRDEYKKAVNAKGINGEEGGTRLFAKDGSTPKYWYNKFKDNKDILELIKKMNCIVVEVGPNDLSDWTSMENLLDLLLENKNDDALLFFQQIESTSGGSQSAIDAFNNHLKEYENTHQDCFYIETRRYPNDLTDGNGKVIHCDEKGLHFKEGLDLKDGKGAYELWAENTEYQVGEIVKRERGLGNSLVDDGLGVFGDVIDEIMDDIAGNNKDEIDSEAR